MPKDYGPCPNCGAATEIRDSDIIYGRSFGLVLICTRYPDCDSFVGCHAKSGEPKGTPAGPLLREYRKKCHAAFDPFWRGKCRRGIAYAALCKVLNLRPEEAHIGMFNLDQCMTLLRIINEGKFKL